MNQFKKPARYITGAIFIFAGLNHFLNPEFYIQMIPPFLPEPAILNILSGIAEMILGIGLMVPMTVNLAVYGLIALLIAIFPANVQMLHDAMNSPTPIFPVWLLVLRLPLQALMIAWVYWLKKEKKHV